MAKGSRFERDVCRSLSAWWHSDGVEDVLFWRTAGSGGRATVRSKRGQSTNAAHCGDIASIDERGRQLTQLITWELKRGYNRASLHELIDRSPTHAAQVYEQWVDQAVGSAKAAKTPYWAIVHQRDRRETILTCPFDLLFGLIGARADFLCPLIRATTKVKGFAHPIELAALPFAEFLNRVTPFHAISLLTRVRPRPST